MFDNLSCINDANDTNNIIESVSIDFEMEIQIEQPETLICDFRGAMFVANPACWALVSVNAKGHRMIVHSSEQDGNFTQRLLIDIKESGPLWLSLLLFCQRDAADPATNATIYCDSLDLGFAHAGDE